MQNIIANLEKAIASCNSAKFTPSKNREQEIRKTVQELKAVKNDYFTVFGSKTPSFDSIDRIINSFKPVLHGETNGLENYLNDIFCYKYLTAIEKTIASFYTHMLYKQECAEGHARLCEQSHHLRVQQRREKICLVG
ncbi:MAG: hypothetical protein ACI9TY_000661 [Alphaproteobacteria bacterium]|jgi:hypothetical protein